MNKIALSAAFYASDYAIKRPELDWTAMRHKLGEALKWYNDFVEENAESKLLKLAVSMEATAQRILYLFVQKFKKGQIENYTLKFTRGYLAAAIGKDYRAPSEMTISRHIERFLQMPNSFIKLKKRSTLQLPDRDCNCISVQIDPKLVVFVSQNHKQAHDFALQNSKNTSAGVVDLSARKHRPNILPDEMDTTAPPLKSNHNPYQQPKETIAPKTASSVGDLMADILKNFQAPS